MTIRQAIDLADGLQPNQYTDGEKVAWLAKLDGQIYNDIILTHHYNRNEVPRVYERYTPDHMDDELIVPDTYAELYVSYLKMKIDENNQETARFNNEAILFNSYMTEFSKFYNRTHMPKSNPALKAWG